ncbi:hypothetical protein [[Mycobacterium] crassicus]|uniref:PPE family C-terminal domain-containing protein n=1 Tax=[Mycobacterium] crassicus TaxID=2872309 RepID=A0ABU5XCX2_9MYCO|nr:hypothetical protein [Mycolicibacter sp. MYC098]MEB3020134.1 hypothetical protein [Mycolicibacter sp. MYC098]
MIGPDGTEAGPAVTGGAAGVAAVAAPVIGAAGAASGLEPAKWLRLPSMPPAIGVDDGDGGT